MRGLTISLRFLLWTFPLFLSSCAGVDQKHATEMAKSFHLAASPAEDLNQQLALVSHSGPTQPQDYAIGPQDLLEITWFNIDPKEDGLPENVKLRVSQTGFITLPLLGEVQVRGLTPAQVEQTLREKYGEYMYRPDMGVRVAEYQSHSVSVLGAVKKPGIYQLTGSTKLADLLAMAGGMTPEAGTFLHVSQRQAEGKQTDIITLSDLSKNANGALNRSVHAGDVINVPRAGSFFVDGYVRKPGAYALSREYTVTQALTVAGGLHDDAKLSEVTLFRRNAQGEVLTLTLNLNQIRNHEAQDIPITENDIIVVPPNMAKMLVSTLFRTVRFAFAPAPFSLGVGSRY